MDVYGWHKDFDGLEIWGSSLDFPAKILLFFGSELTNQWFTIQVIQFS